MCAVYAACARRGLCLFACWVAGARSMHKRVRGGASTAAPALLQRARTRTRPPPRSQLFHRSYSNKHTYIPTSVLSLLLSIYGIAHTSPHLPCSGVMNCCCVALCRKMSRLLLADVQRAAHIWCWSLNSGCSALVCAASASACSTCYFSCQCFCPVCDTFSICGCP